MEIKDEDYKKLIKYFISKYWNSIPINYIPDFVHDAYLKYDKSAPEHVKNIDKAMISWLITTTNNLIKDYLRKPARTVSYSYEKSGGYADNTDWIDKFYNYNIIEEIGINFDLDILKRGLEQKYIDVLLLYSQGYTLKEIASEMKVSKQTVINRINKVRIEMIKLFGVPNRKIIRA